MQIYLSRYLYFIAVVFICINVKVKVNLIKIDHLVMKHSQ